MSDFPPPKGEPPAVSWEPCCALQADPAYQRSIDSRASKKLIEKIAMEWDWRLCAPLTISHRADGQGEMAYFVIDGQHRLAAAELRGDIPDLPCIISQFESFEAEALAFVNINKDRKSVTALDRFHARVAAKEELAVKIKELIEEANLTVARSNDAQHWMPKEIAFPDLVGRYMAQDRDAAETALWVLSMAYDKPLLRGADLFAALFVIARGDWSECDWDAIDPPPVHVAAHVGGTMQSVWIRERDRYDAEHDYGKEWALAKVMLAKCPLPISLPLPGRGRSVEVRRAVKTETTPRTRKPVVAAPNAPEWAKSIAKGGIATEGFGHAPKDLPNDPARAWCEQCEKRVTPGAARFCMDKFCKAKAA